MYQFVHNKKKIYVTMDNIKRIYKCLIRYMNIYMVSGMNRI